MAARITLQDVPQHLGAGKYAFTLLMAILNQECADRFKELLEENHLYQSIKIEFGANHESIRQRIVAGARPEFDRLIQDADFRAVFGVLAASGNLTLNPMNVELFCASKECGKKQAHRAVWYKEIVKEAQANALLSPPLDVPIFSQLFVIVYRCERCFGTPQVVVVRRNEWKFSLEGRSPLEHIDVPKYIPEKERSLYRDAVIASQTGKYLAALFYLRSFIEQWGRRITGKRSRNTGDEIMEAYSKTLPQGLRNTMPSLKEWYDKLSVPIHDARDDAEVFKAAQDKINQHFEIRAAHRIPEEELKPEDAKTEPSEAEPTTQE